MSKRAGLSQRAAAALLGVAPSAVARAVTEKRVPLLPDGSIDGDRLAAAWAENTRARVDGPKPPPPAVPEISYADARAKREHFGARQAEMDYLKSAGKLIDAESAQKAVRDAFHELRDALGRLPRRIAGLGVGLTEPRDLERVVDRELRAVLEAFAQPTEQALTRKASR